ncbi:MAG: hypothetical protein ACK552_05940, partial [Microcystis sp.]
SLDCQLSRASLFAFGRGFIPSVKPRVFTPTFLDKVSSELFLKTIIPSRKATKKYLGDKNNHD